MRKILFEEARQKLKEAGRDDIELLEDSYVNLRSKAKFLDKNTGEIFEAIVKAVIYTGSSSPSAAKQKRRNTNLQKYGNVCSVHGNTDAAKIVKEKIKETSMKKYGVPTPQSSEVIREKRKQTNMERFGVENVSKLKKAIVKETGEYVEDWFLKQSEPKPCSYQSFGAIFLFGKKNNYKQEFEEKELNEYLLKYSSNKTKIEVLAEEIFHASFFNQKPTKNISYRPDFKLNDNVYCNVDGLFWHSEKQKDKKYHFNLRKTFEDNNLRIFQFYENELRNKPQICYSITQNAIGGIKNRIFARKCYIKEVSHKEASVFLTENHMMGSIKAHHIGLYTYDTNNLVSIFSYKKSFDKTCINIERFCSKTGVVVVGGLSKLFKYFEKEVLTRFDGIRQVNYWVDLRYGTGKNMETIGFKYSRDTLGWKWTNGFETFNRLICRANMDERKMSESEHAKEKGLYKIYDAGQRLFTKTY